MVPVKYFEEVGKTVRDSADSSKSGSATHDSGYAEGSQTPAAAAAANTTTAARANAPASRASVTNGVSSDTAPNRLSKSIPKSGGVYGLVVFDFHAERPDELEAKAGEPIIVIAQSNPEWFVAKPITRLGGPGLIPVSFVELRDMASGRPVMPDAVAKAGIPRVEDWKRMAADYKNHSIPLGQVTTREQAQLNLQQTMQRVSLNGAQPPHTNGHALQRSPSNYRYQQQQEQNLFAPVRASVPKFTFADDKFHFVVECKLSNATHWDLSRIYEDFYELQINLINAFPEEAGQVQGRSRTLPYMPGPVKFVTDNITEGRRANLDEYLRDLLKMSAQITSSSLVRNFFHPRDGDYEVDPNAVDLNDHARPLERHERQSQLSQGSYGQVATQPEDQQRSGSAASTHQLNQSRVSNGTYGHQRGQQSLSAHPPGAPQDGHTRSASQLTVQSQSANSTSAPLSKVPTHTSVASTTAPPSGTAATAAAVKVKAWFDRDTCVVIRMPARGQFTYDELYRKIAERRRLEFKSQPVGPAAADADDQLDIEYRDEKDGEYYRLEGDEDLDIALERNEKLTLAVRAARA